MVSSSRRLTMNDPALMAGRDSDRDLRFFPANPAAATTLSPDKVTFYNINGYLAPLRAYSRDEMATIRTYVDDVLDRQTRRRVRGLFDSDWEMRCKGLCDIAMNEVILNCVQDVIGPHVLAWEVHLFCKLPTSQRGISWHQDASYWALTPSKAVTAWLAVDDCCISNGCMRVIPRSHTKGHIPYRIGEDGYEDARYQTVEHPERYGDGPVDIELMAGEFSLHSDLVLHGSLPNASLQRRCGVAIRYVPPDVRPCDPSKTPIAFFCRGSSIGSWQPRPHPSRP
jgi:non-haem Fe2+, alpha-ketoglutarate-dependent halogenase